MASPPGVANASALYGPRVDAAGIPVALSAHAAMTKQPSLARRILRTSALLAALLFGLLAYSADGLFYHPSSAVYATPDSYGLDGVEQVSFAAPGGPQLHGWWLPAAGESRGTVVYCHGNAANLTLHTRYVAWLPARGFDVLVFDYRGYGRSEGSVTRAGTVADAVAAIDYALQRDPDRVVVFGHSLGGAVGIRAAAERPAVRGVVAESTFSNYREIAAEKAPWISWLVPLVISAGFDPDEVLASLPPAPLLVIHGERDHIVPVEIGELLYERAREPKALWKIPEARHMSPWALPARRQEFEARLLQFFAEALASERRPR